MSFEWDSLDSNPSSRVYQVRKATKELRWYKPLHGEKRLEQKFKVREYEASFSYREDYLIRVFEEWVPVPLESEEIPF